VREAVHKSGATGELYRAPQPVFHSDGAPTLPHNVLGSLLARVVVPPSAPEVIVPVDDDAVSSTDTPNTDTGAQQLQDAKCLVVRCLF